MIERIHYETISSDLEKALKLFMKAEIFKSFRLVGGTALSLQFGHRMSVDIDLFSNEVYGTLNFQKITEFMKSQFKVVETLQIGMETVGKTYYVGSTENKLLKVDIYHTDAFVFDALEMDGIRMAAPQEIAAMKLEIMTRAGRKKDFWDLMELLNYFDLKEIIRFHEKRYDIYYENAFWKKQLVNFKKAEEDGNPECLRGNIWELVKEDIAEKVEKLNG